MSYVDIYNQVSNNATVFALLFIIAISLWILAVRKLERLKKSR